MSTRYVFVRSSSALDEMKRGPCNGDENNRFGNRSSQLRLFHFVYFILFNFTFILSVLERRRRAQGARRESRGSGLESVSRSGQPVAHPECGLAASTELCVYGINLIGGYRRYRLCSGERAPRATRDPAFWKGLSPMTD